VYNTSLNLMLRFALMRTFIVIATLLALTLGCAGPSFVSRAIREDDPWFVRLQTYASAGQAGEVQHDHPVNWNDAELSAILSRLFLNERVGLLDQKPAPRPVFAPDELDRLVPAIRDAFRAARPTEWVTFFLTRPGGQGEDVTSGGLYVDGQQLHMIVANHHEVVPPGEEAQMLRGNPLRALKVRGNTLTFEPVTYVLFSRSNWLGGYGGAAASEVIVNHQAFLASLRPTPPVPAKQGLAAVPSAPPAAADRTGDELKAIVNKLQSEIAQLKRRLAEQDAELATLKSRSTAADPSKKKPSKKPVQ